MENNENLLVEDYGEQVRIRREKLSALAQEGKNPYEQTKFIVTETSDKILGDFANYENKIVFNQDNLKDNQIKMQGQNEMLSLVCERESNIVVNKGKELKVDLKYNLPNKLISVKQNECVGSVDIIINGEKYDSINLLSSKTIDEPSYLDYLKRIEQDFVG